MKKRFDAVTGEAYVSTKSEDSLALYRRIVEDLDSDALNKYIKTAYKSLYGQAFKIHRDQAMAEDTVQNALEKILILMGKKKADPENKSFCQESDYFDTWAHRIVITTALTAYEKNKRHGQQVPYSTVEDNPEDGIGQSMALATSLASPFSQSHSFGDPIVVITRREEWARAAELLAHLEDRAVGDRLLRAALCASADSASDTNAFPALTYQDCADAEAVPIGTIRSRISRARERLKDEFGHKITFDLDFDIK